MDGANMKLSDDMLEDIAGGVDRVPYTQSDYSKAGVIVQTKNGKTTYMAKLSNGTTMNINANIAKDMCDCYKISGGTKLTDQQLKDLIAQS